MKFYRLLTGNDPTEFCHKVFEALSKGWDFYGNLTHAHDEIVGVMRCGQTMVKEADGSYSLGLKFGAQW